MRHTIAVFVICLILGTGLAAAGTLTLTLEPSLDGKGDIRATSITDAKLCDFQGICVLNGIPYKVATITNGTAQFSLSDRDAGARLIVINKFDDFIPTLIDPTKDVHQFVGQKLRVSVIGNLSDPTYRIETFTAGQGYDHPAVSYSDGNYSPEALGMYHGDIYTVLSLKTNPSFQVTTLGSSRAGRGQSINSFTPTTPTHPSTSTSINPSFSKWMFGEGSHGNDYDGNDSKCNTCHGNLDTKPLKFSDIIVNNGFCFRCHYGKGGSDKGFVLDTSAWYTPLPTTEKPTTVPYTPITTTANPTATPTSATPRTPAFEALSAIAALLAVLRCRLSR
ncbi:MAG: hypothetical protein WA102_05255 [Candidatus Methanoperedens sp.]